MAYPELVSGGGGGGGGGFQNSQIVVAGEGRCHCIKTLIEKNLSQGGTGQPKKPLDMHATEMLS